jgi:hypothetical protein
MLKFIEMKRGSYNYYDRQTGRWIGGSPLDRHYPYRFIGPRGMLPKEFSEVVQWCEDRMKRKKLWHHEAPKIMFREEIDAFDFKMRWC